MKHLFLIPALAAALLLPATASPSSVAKSYYTCSYRARMPASAGMITMTMSGANVTPAGCRAFNSHGVRQYGRPPGHVLGIWVANEVSIRVVVRATNSFYGNIFCETLDAAISDNFTRIR